MPPDPSKYRVTDMMFVKSEAETEEQPYIAASFVPQYEKYAFIFFKLKLYPNLSIYTLTVYFTIGLNE